MVYVKWRIEKKFPSREERICKALEPHTGQLQVADPGLQIRGWGMVMKSLR